MHLCMHGHFWFAIEVATLSNQRTVPELLLGKLEPKTFWKKLRHRNWVGPLDSLLPFPKIVSQGIQKDLRKLSFKKKTEKSIDTISPKENDMSKKAQCQRNINLKAKKFYNKCNVKVTHLWDHQGAEGDHSSQGTIMLLEVGSPKRHQETFWCLGFSLVPWMCPERLTIKNFSMSKRPCIPNIWYVWTNLGTADPRAKMEHIPTSNVMQDIPEVEPAPENFAHSKCEPQWWSTKFWEKTFSHHKPVGNKSPRG